MEEVEKNRIINSETIIAVSKRAKNKKRWNKERLLQGLAFVGSVVLVAVITVVILVLTRPKLDDEFFVSDDTKSTVTLAPDKDETNGTGPRLIQTRVMYLYNGDDVSGMKTYFEYSDEDTARRNLEMIQSLPQYESAVVEGNFIIATSKEEQYKGLTKSDIQQQQEAIERYLHSENIVTDVPEQVNEEPQTEEFEEETKPEE